MQNQKTRICFIVNPAADRHRSQKHVEWLEQQAEKLWKTFEIIIAGKDDSLSDLARFKSKNFDVIVACGGDGTISQIVNGLAQTDTVLGVLPIGSGNDFVKSIGMNKSLQECLKILRKNHTTEIDLIRYTGDAEGWCMNTIGIGMDGWANYYASNVSWVKGMLIYYLGALKAILRFHGSDMTIKNQGNQKSDHFLMVTACNGKWEGGSFYVALEAEMDDGLMEILSIKNVPAPLLILYLICFRWGPANWMRKVENEQAESVEISSVKPVAVHRDGEHLGADIRHLSLTVEKNALKIIIPPRY